ncbi:hypothetical protein BOTBODRAFT_25916 [Botryobasidium botryosum FD-172 SS1]|uniref:GmrSD restriction endonucleases N-terminal domain-containing protein n=1 Tax=Botryobasidium botryosum (strain FD-172 SS1) TaxID=930990 RepID=A0A067NCG7_BOTB1|nr:hypothetical protein BOTBODRAFT_25916 [Botryobasidium botryosum FD-172 SS1]
MPRTPARKIKTEDNDELTSDDELDLGGGSKGSFEIKNALQPPITGTMTTADLHSLIHQGLIDLNPDYQRDVVWPESKQIGLIDSLFRNYHIPAVIFAMTRSEDGEEYRVCLDGKQRLTSIQKFIDGQIPHRDASTGKKYWYTKSENQTGKLEVPEGFKKQFAKKPITCVEYHGLDQDTERDIFQRVQLGMALTPAEKLQAISSPWANWIRELQKRYISCEGGFPGAITWDITRGKDFQCLCQLVHCVSSMPNVTYPSATVLDKWLRREDPPDQSIKHFVSNVLGDFLYIASTEEYNEGFTAITQRVAPVEFVFIGVLLARMKGASWESKAEAITSLRRQTRAKHRDVRANGTVTQSMWGIVKNMKFSVVDDEDDYSWGDADENGKRKRKRGKNADDEDGDYRPRPVKNLGTKRSTRARASA